jgi:hypothetical protein
MAAMRYTAVAVALATGAAFAIAPGFWKTPGASSELPMPPQTIKIEPSCAEMRAVYSVNVEQQAQNGLCPPLWYEEWARTH